MPAQNRIVRELNFHNEQYPTAFAWGENELKELQVLVGASLRSAGLLPRLDVHSSDLSYSGGNGSVGIVRIMGYLPSEEDNKEVAVPIGYIDPYEYNVDTEQVALDICTILDSQYQIPSNALEYLRIPFGQLPEGVHVVEDTLPVDTPPCTKRINRTLDVPYRAGMTWESLHKAKIFHGELTDLAEKFRNVVVSLNSKDCWRLDCTYLEEVPKARVLRQALEKVLIPEDLRGIDWKEASSSTTRGKSEVGDELCMFDPYRQEFTAYDVERIANALHECIALHGKIIALLRSNGNEVSITMFSSQEAGAEEKGTGN